MASVSRDKNGNTRILFENEHGDRKAIRIGKVPKATAESWRVHVQRLATARIMNDSIPKATAEWVVGLGDKLHAKLSRAGLVEPRGRVELVLLGSFLTSYIKSRTDLKPLTIRHLNDARRNLVGYFGEDRPIASITPGDADEFRLNLRSRLGENTVRRHCGRAKQFFTAAVRKELIKVSPFGDMTGVNVRANRERDHFVTREDIAKVIEAAPDVQWRLIIALARFGGLRTPSETLALRWDDVLWDQGKIIVTSPKTAHHEGKGSRVIPMFPELKEHLDEAWNLLDDEPAEYVITRYRTGQNLSPQFRRIIKRAALAPWEKAFHNCRASRQTELASEYPIHVVCEWIGNSRAVAQEHYLRVTDGDYAKATGKAARNPAQNTRAEGGNDAHGSEQGKSPVPEKPRKTKANPVYKTAPTRT